MVVRCFCDTLIGAVSLMVVDHDDGPDNMASSDACLKIRDERSHRRLQSLGPVSVAAVLGSPVEGFEKLRWQRHAYSGDSLITQHQFMTRLIVLLGVAESAKSITNLRLYITTRKEQVEITC